MLSKHSLTMLDYVIALAKRYSEINQGSTIN